MSNSGGQMIIDLSASAWEGENRQAWFDLAMSAVQSRISEAPQYDASPDYGDGDGTAELAEFAQVWEDANALELARLEQDAEPLAVRSEDRMANALDRIGAGTYVPAGYAAYGLANQGGMETYGLVDDLGYSIDRYPALGYGPATPDIVEAVQPKLADKALEPWADANGRGFYDQYGIEMCLTDHIEAATGVRLADADPYSVRPRRELASAQRPYVHGDPDDPGSGEYFPASTVATVRALAAQAGIQTGERHQAQLAAYRAEHDRQTARLRPPRHADYAEFSNPPAPGAGGLAQFGDEPWNGSLPVFTAGAA
jgi:hypothetical protein